MCLHGVCSNSVAYIVVVAESVTAGYFTSLTESNLTVDDPPPVCVAPSTGRFEVLLYQCTSERDLMEWRLPHQYCIVTGAVADRMSRYRNGQFEV